MENKSGQGHKQSPTSKMAPRKCSRYTLLSLENTYHLQWRGHCHFRCCVKIEQNFYLHITNKLLNKAKRPKLQNICYVNRLDIVVKISRRVCLFETNKVC